VIYLLGLSLMDKLQTAELTLPEAIALYTFTPFPSQLVLVCGVVIVAYGVRRILFY
jgi:biotin transport system substrate-specific component